MTPTDEANQRLLNEAWYHILEQGRASKDQYNRCAYTDENGNHCAFWPAIARYTPDMESLPFYSLRRDYKDSLHPWALALGAEFVDSLQCCHDGIAELPDASFVHEFKRRMRNLAEGCGYTVPKEAP